MRGARKTRAIFANMRKFDRFLGVNIYIPSALLLSLRLVVSPCHCHLGDRPKMRILALRAKWDRELGEVLRTSIKLASLR